MFPSPSGIIAPVLASLILYCLWFAPPSMLMATGSSACHVVLPLLSVVARVAVSPSTLAVKVMGHAPSGKRLPSSVSSVQLAAVSAAMQAKHRPIPKFIMFLFIFLSFLFLVFRLFLSLFILICATGSGEAASVLPYRRLVPDVNACGVRQWLCGGYAVGSMTSPPSPAGSWSSVSGESSIHSSSSLSTRARV